MATSIKRSLLAQMVRAVVPARWRPIRYLENLTRSGTRSRVQKGPFAGMEYGNNAIGSAYIPKLLGMYERELGAAIEAACQRAFRRIIVIGAGEGYYAIGMARRNPNATVIAFEGDSRGRAEILANAEKNEVGGRIDVRPWCDVIALRHALGDEAQPYIICDAEGNEDTLLQPDQVPALRRAAILVEVHEFAAPGVARRIVERFGGTHTIEQIWQESRASSEYPFTTMYTRLLPRSYLEWAVSEWRPERMSWLWLQPRSP